jgi:hypothetical protein
MLKQVSKKESLNEIFEKLIHGVLSRDEAF